MIKLKSWRWSRLDDPSALKRLWTHPQWIIPLVIVLLTLWLVTDKTLDLPKSTAWLCWWFAFALLIFAVILNICCADAYYEIKSGKKIIRKIYLYTSGFFSKKSETEMIILTKNEQIRTNILDYDFEEWDDFSSFLFSLADDKDWYYSSPVYEAELLGRPFSTTVYYQPERPKRIKILDGHGLSIFDADAFIINGIFIPPLAKKQITDAITEERVEPPQEYLIAKRGKKYTVYGLYFDKAPACLSLAIPTVIFKEGGQDVILKYHEETEYREIYRTHYSMKRSVNDVFVELSYHHGIGGTVKKFNEETGKLDLIYKGYFHAIDFDSGAILGDKGFEYVPE